MFHDSVGNVFKGAVIEQGKNYLAAVMGAGMKCHWGLRRNDEDEKIQAEDFLKARERSFQSWIVVGSGLSSGAQPNSHQFIGGQLRRCDKAQFASWYPRAQEQFGFLSACVQ